MLLAIVAALTVLSGAPPQTQDDMAVQPESDVAAFRRLRAEAGAALTADELDRASELLTEAAGRVPNHAGVTLLRARVAAALDDTAGALDLLGRLARMGVAFDPASDPALATLRDLEGFEQIRAMFQANRQPVGVDRLDILATVSGSGLAEAVVYDARRERWLVSQVAGRGIVVLPAGTEEARPFLAEPLSLGALGMAIDAASNRLWLVASAAPPAVASGASPDAAAMLLAIDLADGRVAARHPLPPSERTRGPGDILLAPDGTVFVADGLAGDILRLEPGGSALAPFLQAGQLGSPQGMVMAPDGQALIVADYSSGLWRAPLDGGPPHRMAAPADANLIGIDGLIIDGRSLYALQNGAAPQRILRLTLDAWGGRIEAVQTLAANLPEIDQPTNGQIAEGRLVFVARSQWSAFTADGVLRTADPEPAIIASLALD